MKKLLYIITLFILVILSGCDFLEKRVADFVDNALTDTTYIVSIPQDIGGELLCNVNYSDDFHSWDYYVDYNYINGKGDTIEVGSGRYSGRNWKENEQILTIGSCYILKSGSDRKSDKLLIGQKDSNEKWKEYIFSPNSIEKEELWKSKKIDSNPNNGDSEVRIEIVETNGSIIINYVFAKKDRVFAFMTGRRKIIYSLDLDTGIPYLTEISKK